MLKNLVLERPLAVIDLETTGTNPQVDRIVEISVLKILPDGQRKHRTRRLHPGMPIPAEATAIHGITDADVADQPPFARLACGLLAFLEGCDLCGFNIKQFDLRFLQAEFRRANLVLPLEGRAIVDPLEIFHAYERRNLTAAVRFYCGREHPQVHQAAADVLATIEVLDAMVAHYVELPRSVAGLHQHFKGPNIVDSSDFFTRVNDQIHFKKGKHRGQSLEAVAQIQPDYLEWMLAQDFFDDTKELVRAAQKDSRSARGSCPPQPDVVVAE